MPAETSAGLPTRAYLIAYDVERQKLTGNSPNELVQAAALVQLSLAGLLTDENGKAQASGGRTGDPVLDSLLDRISDSRLRSWKHWVTSDPKLTHRAIRDRLAAERLITVEDKPMLGLIPRQLVTVLDTRIVGQLITETRSAVISGTPVDRVGPEPAALAAMVAAVELNTVFSSRERREHRDKIKELAERSGPVVKALRKAVEEQQSA